MNFNEINSVAEYERLRQQFASVEGWLTALEGYALFKLAEIGPGVGRIVEIGSFLGKSTCWLATGSQQASREKVAAVDHFSGSPEHQPGQGFECEAIVREGTTYNRFLDNIRSVGVEGYIDPIKASSEEAAGGWRDPIRLLFIDGDHSYEATRLDFSLWFPFVCSGGIVCFHDIGAWEGCTRYYNELVQSASGEVHQLGRVGSIGIVQKV